MDASTLHTSSTLSGDTVAELYAAFRKRVSEKSAAVKATVDAFASQDPEAFMMATADEIGDGAFDTALKESFERGEIDADLYHGMMFSLLEAASCSTEHDSDGHSFTTTELFAMPVTGTIEEILEVTSDFDALARLATAFTSTGYVSEGVQVILSPTTVDPIAASRLTCAIARETVESFVPHFTDGYTREDANDLFEAVQAAFEFIGDHARSHLEERGRVTRLVIGATRRIHSTVYPTSADAFIANFIDENHCGTLQDISDGFLDLLNESAPGSIAYNMPLPIARATAFSALATVADNLSEEAAAMGIRRADFLMDEISVSRHGEQTAVEGVLDERILGPVLVRDALIQRDRLWFINNLGRLCDELQERDRMLTTVRSVN
jgi:hypothetical protein